MMISHDLMQSTRRCVFFPPRTRRLGVRLLFFSLKTSYVCVPTPAHPHDISQWELAVIHDFQMALYGESDVSTRKKSTGKEVHKGDDQKEEDINAASSGFEVV